MCKQKVINDPIYGLISIKRELVFKVINHPWVQRLRRIKQLGMIDLVYPSANHVRFSHALGSMYLMDIALASLQEKGVKISEEEQTAALIAVLLHDIGHGPFSHTLEFSLLSDVSHESMGQTMLLYMNKEFNGELDLVLQIFQGKYHRKFFNQLISSQLDVDRLDYLNRDCFFTGVFEGRIGTERIIKLMNVVNDELVIEEKGVFSCENFLHARKLMYWEVYFHKTSVSAEVMLIEVIRRAKMLCRTGARFAINPNLLFFLERYTGADNIEKTIWCFTNLDDHDIISALKIWALHKDYVLSSMSKMILERKLLATRFSEHPISSNVIDHYLDKCVGELSMSIEEASYFVKTGKLNIVSYSSYNPIKILKKDNKIVPLDSYIDIFNLKSKDRSIDKYFLSTYKCLLLGDENKG